MQPFDLKCECVIALKQTRKQRNIAVVPCETPLGLNLWIHACESGDKRGRGSLSLFFFSFEPTSYQRYSTSANQNHLADFQSCLIVPGFPHTQRDYQHSSRCFRCLPPRLSWDHSCMSFYISPDSMISLMASCVMLHGFLLLLLVLCVWINLSPDSDWKAVLQQRRGLRLIAVTGCVML